MIDRLQFGLISASFGAVIGALASLVVLGILTLAGFSHSFNLWMIGFSAGFFFFLGMARGAESADVVADSLVISFLAALVAIGIGGGDATVVDRSPEWRPSMGWAIFYFSGMALLAWFA